jgi:ElaB protein
MESNAESLAPRGNGGSVGQGGNIAQLGKAVSPDLEQLTRDFRTFVTDCEMLLKNATTLSGSGAAVARAQLSDKLAAAKIKVDAMRMTAGDRAVRTRAATEDYVRREPMKAIGYAAAAGAILGLLMSRR